MEAPFSAKQKGVLHQSDIYRYSGVGEVEEEELLIIEQCSMPNAQ
ncbi:MAG: hypothetical protein V7L05_12900 [Nostoc sp.]